MYLFCLVAIFSESLDSTICYDFITASVSSSVVSSAAAPVGINVFGLAPRSAVRRVSTIPSIVFEGMNPCYGQSSGFSQKVFYYT